MRESMFEYGDQDYGSMAGWDPHKENLRKMTEEAKKKYPRMFSPPPEMLFVRPAAEHMENAVTWQPVKQLFGPLWLNEEVAVLYSMPGVGKTALAMQLAETLARGVPLAPFDKPLPGCEVPPQRVLYIDFELTRSQFAERYATISKDGLRIENAYQFSPNLLRAELFWDGRMIDGYDDFTDMLFTDIENKMNQHEAEVLICDNITFLSHSSTANSSIAFRLMNRFQQLRTHRFMSILIVAHTPKRRPHMPLGERDLQGSIDLAKVADSMFAVGPSSLAPDLRYIKHIKSRSARIENGSEKVLVYRLGKFDLAAENQQGSKAPKADNFFGYSFIGTDDETVHLAAPFRPIPVKRRPKLDNRRIKYAKLPAKQGLSTSEIGRRLGVSKPTAHRYLVSGRPSDRLT